MPSIDFSLPADFYPARSFERKSSVRRLPFTSLEGRRVTLPRLDLPDALRASVASSPEKHSARDLPPGRTGLTRLPSRVLGFGIPGSLRNERSRR